MTWFTDGKQSAPRLYIEQIWIDQDFLLTISMVKTYWSTHFQHLMLLHHQAYTSDWQVST